MSITRLVLSLFGRDVRRPRRPARFRPQLTALESRWLPATITEFPLPPLTFNPIISTAGITGGPDGNVWFTEPATGVVGRITPAGQVTEFPTPVSNPGAIAAGPNGNLWFTEVKSRQIGEYFLVGTPPAPAAATTTTLAADVGAPAAGQTAHLAATSLGAGGHAVLATAFSPSGSHTLTAVFNGTAAFAPSQSPALRETVKPVSTRTTLTVSASSAAVGQMLVMTATVKPAFAGGRGAQGQGDPQGRQQDDRVGHAGSVRPGGVPVRPGAGGPARALRHRHSAAADVPPDRVVHGVR